MLNFIPFQRRHLGYIDIQPTQRDVLTWYSHPEYVEALQRHGVALTAIGAEGGVPGRVAGCAGLLHQWRGRALAWALIGDIRRREWVQVAERMQDMIENAQRNGLRRVEAHARENFGGGCRLLEHLGFEREALMCGFTPDGGNMWLYARIR